MCQGFLKLLKTPIIWKTCEHMILNFQGYVLETSSIYCFSSEIKLKLLRKRCKSLFFCRTLQLKIDLKLETKETYTVCGKLYGKEEPSKFLLLKKHQKNYVFQFVLSQFVINVGFCDNCRIL